MTEAIESKARQLLTDGRIVLGFAGPNTSAAGSSRQSDQSIPPQAAPAAAGKDAKPLAHFITFIVVFLTALLGLGGAAALFDDWLQDSPHSLMMAVLRVCITLFLAFAGLGAAALTPFTFMFWVFAVGDRMNKRFGVLDMPR